MKRKHRIRRHRKVSSDVAHTKGLQINGAAMLLDQDDGTGQPSRCNLVLKEIGEGLELFWRRHGHFDCVDYPAPAHDWSQECDNHEDAGTQLLRPCRYLGGLGLDETTSLSNSGGSVRHPHVSLSFLIADSASSTRPPGWYSPKNLLNRLYGMTGDLFKLLRRPERKVPEPASRRPAGTVLVQHCASCPVNSCAGGRRPQVPSLLPSRLNRGRRERVEFLPHTPTEWLGRVESDLGLLMTRIILRIVIFEAERADCRQYQLAVVRS
jgi:hypothetical protein